MSSEVQTTRDALDTAAAAAAGLTLLDIIPAIAAVFSILWLTIRIYEQVTGREFSTTRIARFITGIFHRD